MSPKQQKALLALLTQPTRERAASAAGVSPKTLRRYMESPEFQREYRAAFSSLVSDAARQAQQTLSPALTTLRQIMEDSEQNGQIRVSAARSLLEFGLKATEQLDIMERLTALEEALQNE